MPGGQFKHSIIATHDIIRSALVLLVIQSSNPNAGTPAAVNSCLIPNPPLRRHHSCQRDPSYLPAD